MYKLPIGFIILMFAASCARHKPKEEIVKVMEIPKLKREFRAAWVATVANIDWPSKPGLDTQTQKQELLQILDKSKELNLNAVILQVRPQCDALYDSPLEPWSYYLTEKMGKAPDPYYDPLEFAVKEAHKRGLELHAWFNPYRANHPANKGGISEDHISKKNPQISKNYGKYMWLDPGEKATQDHTMDVIMDVVNRYDIDGVHIDDYFYPYKERDKDGKIIDFPDESSWGKYKNSGGVLSRSDWRRQNVNSFVERFYNEVKQAKPWVKLGISPFGIWRPGYPEGIKGLDQYEQLYADARLWLQKGWVDYFTPQLYWKIDSEGQPYKPLLNWWVEQNDMQRHIWPGNFTSRIPDSWKAEEIINQIKATRDQPGATGNVHFSMICLMKNSDRICDKLKQEVYKYPVLVPACPWLSTGELREVPSLDVKKEGENIIISWSIASDKPVRNWVLSKRQNGVWSYKIFPGENLQSASMKNEEFQGMEVLAVTAVDRFNQESPQAIVRIEDLDL